MFQADHPFTKGRVVFTRILRPSHLIIVLVIALLVLGPKRLPDAGRALGQGFKEFTKSVSGGHNDAPPRPTSAPAEHENDPLVATCRSDG
jgi:sec-independent protein translocase protein TatA